MAVLGRLGPSWGASWAVLGPLGGVLGPSWVALGGSWGGPGASWGRLGGSWARPGALWERLGAVLEPSWAVNAGKANFDDSSTFLEHFRGPRGGPGGLLEGSRGLLGGSWRRLGASWARLGRSWGLLVAPWSVLAPSWPVLGGAWASLGAVKGESWRVPGASGERSPSPRVATPAWSRSHGAACDSTGSRFSPPVGPKRSTVDQNRTFEKTTFSDPP